MSDEEAGRAELQRRLEAVTRGPLQLLASIRGHPLLGQVMDVHHEPGVRRQL